MSLEDARLRDAADPLRAYRQRFHLPDGVIYLDGNSLGALPRATLARLEQVMRAEWGERLIRSWNDTGPNDDGAKDDGANDTGWIRYPQRVGAKIAALVGAAPDEVIACDTVSVNLFKLIGAALAMQPGRKVILSEPGNFPTDLYMIAGLEKQGLAQRRLAAPDAIEAALDGEVALLMLTHVHYKSGRMHDMVRLTQAAQDAGALVLWDLSHSGGALPVDLDGCNADFAVGCGYKYLNGGPGAPAYAFVAARHHAALSQPLTGWMGHAQPFAFSDDYRPAPGVDRLLAGTPGILGLAALEVGVDLIAEIGIDRLAQKSRQLSEFFRACVTDRAPDLELVSPRDPLARGSQLSFRHDEAYAICQALIARGIIGDFRDPDILRFGFAPAYVSFEDAFMAAENLAHIIATREWDAPRFKARSAVT
ncbi:kynureninase [Altererythrobacter confluentis]|uniref:Kynureninase n=1 Tax=Allopontixanthobacter confluentis TaxID=1849021 RepID=A0A6L7GHN5_9SPHN|nr:kynureninase [Allopontixanthobacter confluentis]MXP15006.1 kynureninase [Allopontixanthobacter confluentis]